MTALDVIEGQLGALPGSKVAIAVSRFNDTFTKTLLDAAVTTLKRAGLNESDITVVWVPGAFELPLICQTLAETETYDAVIALGCVVRGATPHFDYVCSQAASGLLQAGLATGVPVIFGVVTTDTLEQAMERCGTKAGNKGADAAMTAIEMMSVLSQLDSVTELDE